MIHYHGLPITPATAAVEVAVAGHVFISHRHRQQVGIIEFAQSFALDNGAFSAWSSGTPITDWGPYYEWVDELRFHPGFDFAVIPDVIDGDEDANDKMLDEWPFDNTVGAPVWHMHEPIDRLMRLCRKWKRVCLGSSGEYSQVGSAKWWSRMSLAMDCVCTVRGQPIAKLHGLRMLNPKVFSKLPLASADSTNIARNIGIDKNWQRGSYLPATKEARAKAIRHKIEHWNGAERWESDL